MFELFQKFVTIFVNVCIVLFVVLVICIVAAYAALVVESRLDKPQAAYEHGGKYD